MTAWERGLRPKPERQRLLWLLLAVLVVFVAWRGAEWLLALHQQRRAVPPPPPSSAVRVPTAPAPADTGTADAGARPSPPESYGVTKCLSASGKAEYSDGPCPAGSRATTVWVQPDVNLADGLGAAEREASMRNNSAVATARRQHEERVARNTGGDALGECARLDAHIKWIDAMARQPQSAWQQDELMRDRKESRDRQFRLGCR